MSSTISSSYLYSSAKGVDLPLKSYRSLKSERGATMVEYALVIIVFLGLIGLVVDGGLAIRNHTYLTRVTAELATDRAINIELYDGLARVLAIPEANCAGCVNAAQLNNCINSIGVALMEERFGYDEDLTFSAVVEPSRSNPAAGYIVIRGQLDHPCYFCTIFGHESFALSTNSSAPLETGLRCVF